MSTGKKYQLLIMELRDCDHAFVNEEGVAYFAQAFGLAGKIGCQLHYANPQDLKGLTLANGAVSAYGMDAAILARKICDMLGVKYASKFGRGSQLQACCDALAEHFKVPA